MIENTKKPVFPELRSARFLIHPLREVDVSDAYVSWFLDNTAREFITAAQAAQTIDSLKSYVRENLESPHSFLLGIFPLGTNRHIGNIKFDHITAGKGSAIVGVLIGEPEWRGKGVFKEVFERAAQHLFSSMEIKNFWLGVHRTNAGAIKAYRKTGFKEALPPEEVIQGAHQDGFYMCCTFD